MRIVCVYVNEYNKTIGIRVSDGCDSKDVHISCISPTMKFDNAIVTKSGVIRAKSGHIERKVIHSGNSTNILQLKRYVNNKLYDGTTDKVGITYKGLDYIVKSTNGVNDTSVISEYVASHFINNIGYKAHNTILRMSENGLCVLIEDFVNSLGKLHPYKDTKQSSEGTNINTKTYTYKDIQYMIKMHTKIPNSLKADAIKQFWYMFFIDAILANRDRHMGNWGYIENSKGYVVSPMYDNGACLFPDVLRVFSQYKSDKYKFIFDRYEQFPASVIMEERDDGTVRRTNFYTFINRTNLLRYNVMNSTYRDICNIGIENIYSAITKAVHNEYIPFQLQEFYVNIVVARYMHIILRKPFSEIRGYLHV